MKASSKSPTTDHYCIKGPNKLMSIRSALTPIQLVPDQMYYHYTTTAAPSSVVYFLVGRRFECVVLWLQNPVKAVCLVLES